MYGLIGEDFWTGEGVTAKRVAAALREIGDSQVTVNINSPGGDFFEGVAIYTVLREHKAKINVNVVGIAASAASVIAMAGDEIAISKVGFFMVHNTWAIAIGNRHDMRAAADLLEPFDASMAGLYAARAEADLRQAETWMDEETWFNGDQAVAAGLADGLMASTDLTENQKASVKAFAADRRVECALMHTGMSRDERRSLIGEIKGGRAVAGPDRSAVASDWMAGARRLMETMKG
jgi:ATP-dependent protease ClpP protease subunit